MTDYEAAFWKLKNNWHESVKHYEDRIEKLEAALQAVIRYAGNAGDDYLADKARKALEGKDET